MLTLVDDRINDYIEKFIPQLDPTYTEIQDWTKANTQMPQMLSGPYQCELLAYFAKLTQCKTILEIGTFTGFTSLYLAEKTRAENITSLEFDSNYIKAARNFHRKHPSGSKVQILEGPALETLETLKFHRWDFVFIDADKENYINYFEAIKNNLNDHGIIIADNVLWSGKVCDPENIEASTVALRKSNEHISHQENFESIILPVRDGLNLIKKK